MLSGNVSSICFFITVNYHGRCQMFLKCRRCSVSFVKSRSSRLDQRRLEWIISRSAVNVYLLFTGWVAGMGLSKTASQNFGTVLGE